MIGVISKDSEKAIVREFFELFKTPWEFYSIHRSYETVIVSDENDLGAEASLMILFGSKETKFDQKNNIRIQTCRQKPILVEADKNFPIFGNAVSFNSPKKVLFTIKETGEAIGLKIKQKNQTIYRFGFDLFQEISILLTSGQPAEHAFIPTLEIYISLLRKCILETGQSLVEIPPVPAGYNFMACLTHDVDFVGIKNHKFDHTMFGFIYRACLGSIIRLFKRKISISQVAKNWAAVLSLPLVHLKLAKDFWFQFKRYLEIEKSVGSTFFFIPFKNRSGTGISEKIEKRRATKYDVSDIGKTIHELAQSGCEVGLHGIDAWQNVDKGREEFNQLFSVTKNAEIGVRMHWLYFSKYSPKLLEKAGFFYDTTFGYNDTIGFKGGTSQVFMPPGVKRLMELPLHIQDTALFFPNRMDLDENEAESRIENLLDDVRRYGGVLTLNWHHRSIAPERLWDGFYINVLNRLKKQNVWMGTGRQIVKWFKKRRSVSFEKVELVNNTFKVKLSTAANQEVPDLLLRIHSPKKYRTNDDQESSTQATYSDFPFADRLHIDFPVLTNGIQKVAFETAA